jgi:hypothetical protein
MGLNLVYGERKIIPSWLLCDDHELISLRPVSGSETDALIALTSVFKER